MLSACSHAGPLLDFGSRPPSAEGTIAGMVSTADSGTPVINRRVIVTDVRSAAKYQVTTALNGGYTVQVPKGTYRIELALESGESYRTRPSDTRIGKGHLDLHRDFVITGTQQPQGR